MENNEKFVVNSTGALSVAEREELKGLSLKAYGKANQWRVLFDKGNKYTSSDKTRNGDHMKVTKIEYFTLLEIVNRMNGIIESEKKS